MEVLFSGGSSLSSCQTKTVPSAWADRKDIGLGGSVELLVGMDGNQVIAVTGDDVAQPDLLKRWYFKPIGSIHMMSPVLKPSKRSTDVGEAVDWLAAIVEGE